MDKVERLLDLLGELGEHPFLREKLALHGGTSINLFLLDVPRLSVDIDISYVGSLVREDMLADRPLVERAIGEVARSQGYSYGNTLPQAVRKLPPRMAKTDILRAPFAKPHRQGARQVMGTTRVPSSRR